MNLHIRPFAYSDADYAAMAALRDAIFPEYPITADEWRRMDEKRDPKCDFVRVAAECDGQLVGLGHYGHMAWMFHPRKFDFGVHVYPEYQGRGIGGQIYDHLMAELAPREPISIRHNVREDYLASLRWVARRGFVEDMRFWESRLDVPGFKLERFAGHVEKVLAQGVEIATLAELEARDADFWPRYYALDLAAGADVPSPEPQTPVEFAQWRKYFDGPSFIPEAHFIAVADGQYVGLSALWRRDSTSDLETGFTGVHPAYRRRGIALALKLCAVDYARRVGAPMIRTDNETNNRPMLSINEALGFVRQPAWISMVNRLREG